MGDGRPQIGSLGYGPKTTNNRQPLRSVASVASVAHPAQVQNPWPGIPRMDEALSRCRTRESLRAYP